MAPNDKISDPKTGIKRTDQGNPVKEKQSGGKAPPQRLEPQFGHPEPKGPESNKPSGPIISPPPKEESNKTRVMRPETLAAKAPPPDRPRPPDRPAPSDKTRVVRPQGVAEDVGPVTGWLVVLEGPGKGRSVALSYGVQSLGRGVDQDIALAFGDSAISERRHATIAYDPEARCFWLAHAEGRNLTKVGGQPVLSQRQLNDGDMIEVGATKLRFVAFCGPDFAWA